MNIDSFAWLFYSSFQEGKGHISFSYLSSTFHSTFNGVGKLIIIE